jgi:hypothetical protein
MKKVPEHICTNVRKVEPLGEDCVRIYCATPRNGKWEDQFTVVMSTSAAIDSARFVIKSTAAIFNESEVAGIDRECVH